MNKYENLKKLYCLPPDEIEVDDPKCPEII